MMRCWRHALYFARAFRVPIPACWHAWLSQINGSVQEMELGSHPDLESIPDDLSSISDFVGSALKGASAPVTSSVRDPSSSSAESNRALRRLLLKQMPAVEVSAGLTGYAAAAVPKSIPYLPREQMGLTNRLLQLVHTHFWCSLLCHRSSWLRLRI